MPVCFIMMLTSKSSSSTLIRIEMSLNIYKNRNFTQIARDVRLGQLDPDSDSSQEVLGKVV